MAASTVETTAAAAPTAVTGTDPADSDAVNFEWIRAAVFTKIALLDFALKEQKAPGTSVRLPSASSYEQAK